MDAEVEIFGDRLPKLFAFIEERHRIWERREAGLPKPWTQDPVLQRYRFCCSYRDNDRVTRWLRGNWYWPNRDNTDLWFVCVVARFFNLPASLEELRFPVPWDPTRCKLVMSDRARRGLKNYNGAYMIRSGPGNKTDYLVEHVFTPLWHAREAIRPQLGMTLSHYHFLLTSYTGLGSFLAAQVIADLKAYVPLKDAPDWWTFASPGPGSMKGLNWVMGRPFNSPWKPEEWHANVLRLRNALIPYYERAGLPVPCAQDIQNIALCEGGSKYFKTLEGLGRPKQLYPGSDDATFARNTSI